MARPNFQSTKFMEINAAGFRSVGQRHLEDVLWLKKFLLGEIYAGDVFHKKNGNSIECIV